MTSCQKLVAYCDGGLGNRLNSLIGALYLAELLRMDFQVSWPINRWCGAEFDDLFDSPYISDKLSMIEHNSSSAKCMLVAHEVQSFSINQICNPNDFFTSGSLVKNIRRKLPSSVGLLYYNSTVPSYIPIATISRLIESIGVKNEFMEIASDFSKNSGLVSNNYWGLHLRGTDAGFSRFYYDFWFYFVKLLRGPVVLCTDDKRLANRFLEINSVMERSKISLPTKAAEGIGWNDRSVDEYGREFNYNISRSKSSMLESMVDFKILSNSKLLYTSQSTFLENACRFGSRWTYFWTLVSWSRYVFRLSRRKFAVLKSALGARLGV